MIVIKKIRLGELLGDNDQEYTYSKRESPNNESKPETGNNTRVGEEITGNPIKTDKIVINGKEYHGESIDKALERARVLKNAREKGIITDEEHTVAIDDLANGLEQERLEQETEDYRQTVVKGPKTWGESVGEAMQLIIDRLQNMHNELKEPTYKTTQELLEELQQEMDRKAERGEEQISFSTSGYDEIKRSIRQAKTKEEKEEKEGMIKTHIRYKMYEDAWKIQKWLKENWPDYVIMISSDHISIVNREVTK